MRVALRLVVPLVVLAALLTWGIVDAVQGDWLTLLLVAVGAAGMAPYLWGRDRRERRAG